VADGSNSNGDGPRRLLLVSRGRYQLPLDEALARKFDALGALLEIRVVAGGGARENASDPRFALVRPLRLRALDGPTFYLSLPLRVAREWLRFEPNVVLVQGAHEAVACLVARRIARSRAPIILDIHGDWRQSTRLYGSPFRRALSPLGDRMARFAIQRVDAIRTVSDYTSSLVRRLGREADAVFPAYVDAWSFIVEPPVPLPERRPALFIGVLERYKNIDGLANAWRLAAPRVPDATLRIVGNGRLTRVVEDLLGDLPEQTSWEKELTTGQVADALDEATLLVLPSRSEGMGRVIIESFCRARPVVGARIGGIPDLVQDGVNGILVDAGDTPGLADALVRVLSDDLLAERLSDGARESGEPWLQTPELYAERVRELVETTIDPRLHLPGAG
jgi:glycosyltransferase involved in cell wall biosynthesis